MGQVAHVRSRTHGEATVDQGSDSSALTWGGHSLLHFTFSKTMLKLATLKKKWVFRVSVHRYINYFPASVHAKLRFFRILGGHLLSFWTYFRKVGDLFSKCWGVIFQISGGVILQNWVLFSFVLELFSEY